jgi:hypothetical protein
MVLSGVYVATAAPDLTLWDAPEFATAAHTLGIPHPPGTPLWVLLGRVSALVFTGAIPSRAITMLSVVSTALAGGLSAWLMTRWVGVRAAIAGAVMAGTMFSVWNNATETEVYATSLLWSVLLLTVGAMAGDDRTAEPMRRRLRGVLAYLAPLSIALHLSALVVMPAVIWLAWRRPRPSWRDLLGWSLLALLGLSAVAILPFLASRAPVLDSGHPVTLDALLAVLRREQYAVAGLWPRMTPYWLQLGNVAQWLDWQVAFGAHPSPAPSLVRTLFTVVWAGLAGLGLFTLSRTARRPAWALGILLVCGTAGVATWLNMRAGPSFGAGVLPQDAIHEARERDYFFVLGFWGWGLLAGVGAVAVGEALAKGIRTKQARWTRPALAGIAALPLLIAAVPTLINWRVVDRRREPMASLPRVYGRLLLESVPPDGVLVAGGDNDTFPLWYLQQVEMLRPDVRIVTVPLLPARWYRDELAAAGLLATFVAERWTSSDLTLRSVMLHAEQQRRSIRVSTMVDRRSRVALDPTMGWALEGLVYSPTRLLEPGSTGLDLVSMQRTIDRTPPSALAALPRGVDPAIRHLQQLLRCSQVRTHHDDLLVSWCHGI